MYRNVRNTEHHPCPLPARSRLTQYTRKSQTDTHTHTRTEICVYMYYTHEVNRTCIYVHVYEHTYIYTILYNI